MDIRIPIVIVTVIVATAIFVVIIRANRARDDKGRGEAHERGETVTPRKFNPTLVYFLLGLAFVAVGLVTLLKP
jgi:large-conductance mechanosensitive channel